MLNNFNIRNTSVFHFLAIIKSRGIPELSSSLFIIRSNFVHFSRLIHTAWFDQDLNSKLTTVWPDYFLLLINELISAAIEHRIMCPQRSKNRYKIFNEAAKDGKLVYGTNNIWCKEPAQ